MADKTILVAEDNDEWRSLIAFWLQKQGYAVVLSSNGRDVISLAEKSSPDCFVFDFELGDCTAADLIRQVRGRFPDTPVIFLTTLARAMIRLPPGCLPEQFIVKSQSSMELLAVLEDLFSGKK
jgi:CheY-like chemotaxis protein